MAELPPGLDQLPGDLESAATPPPFGSLVERSRVRRRRHTAGAAIAVAIAIVAVASGTVAGRQLASPTPEPSGPRPSPATSADTSLPAVPAPQGIPWTAMTPAQQLAWARAGSVSAVAVDEQGDTFVVWQRTDDAGATHSAWELMVTSTNGVIHEGIVAGQFASVVATPEGFVLDHSTNEAHALLITGAGKVEPFRTVSSGTVREGDIEVQHGTGVWIADPRTLTWWMPNQPFTAGGVTSPGAITANGRAWVWPFGMDGEPETRDGGPILGVACGRAHCPSVAFPSGTSPGKAIAFGDHLVAFSTELTKTTDTRLGSPVRSWAVSTDGVHVHVYPASAVPFTSVTSMATTGTGYLLVSDGTGRVWISAGRDWLHFSRLDIGPVFHRVKFLTSGLHGDMLAWVARSGPPTLLMIDSHTYRVAEWIGPGSPTWPK